MVAEREKAAMPRATAPDPITLAWASDIHLDHASPEAIREFFDWIRGSGASSLLLGGDITHARRLEQTLREIAELAGIPVLFVLGNHDYYGSSIAAVRGRMEALRHPDLVWLPAAGSRILAPGITLAGHGGWGDARVGSFAGSRVFLTDYYAIEELARACDLGAFNGRFAEGTDLEKELNRQGDLAAASLAPQLEEAAATGRHVLVLTHVPPFREACWHEGHVSDEWWLPAFTCRAVGDLILEVASRHPETRFTVLCGHTHGEGVAAVAPNVTAYTQGALYEQPAFRILEVDPASVRIRDWTGPRP